MLTTFTGRCWREASLVWVSSRMLEPAFRIADVFDVELKEVFRWSEDEG